MRTSAPPAKGRWQLPHATVLSLESCSSQKRTLPSTAFCGVSGFSGGADGGVSWPKAGTASSTNAATQRVSMVQFQPERDERGEKIGVRPGSVAPRPEGHSAQGRRRAQPPVARTVP
jgi:hypothetical protein